MSKDPFQILADELTLIRKDMDQLQRTSLDKKDAQALHKKLAEGVDRMYRAAPEVQQAIDNRLMAVAAFLAGFANSRTRISVIPGHAFR